MTKQVLTESEIPYPKYFLHFENWYWARAAVPSFERAFGLDKGLIDY
jgi:hypothetical protein